MVTRRRRLKQTALGIAAFAAALLVAGAAVNAWYEHQDDRRFPPRGRFIKVVDHKLLIDCTGQGPTVILEGGAGSSSLYFRRVQRALESSMRVCTYDRAGLGASEIGSGRYDIATSADELHELLRAAGLPLPVIIVGHSLGANIAAYYGAHYRADLAGLVLIDPGTPEDLFEDFKGSPTEALAMTRCGWRCDAAAFAARVGVVRLAARHAGTVHMNADETAEYRAQLARPTNARATMGTIVFLPKSALQMKEVRTFGDLPVTVMASSALRKPEGKETHADVVKWRARYLEQLRALAGASTHGRGPVIVPNTTHLSVGLDDVGVNAIADEVKTLATRR